VAAALAFALALQGSRPIWDPDEGRYVDVALQMLRSGDWWTPHLHPEVPHLSKPPLTYWLIASSLRACGRSEWAARLPEALAFAATILLVGGIARRLAPGADRAAAVVYATSLLPFVAASILTTDTLLASWVALASWGLVELAFGAGPPGRARVALWAGFGLAFLTKGPPAALPILGLVAGLAATRRLPRGDRRAVSVASVALFLPLGFGWYLHEIATHPDVLGYWLGREVVDRVSSAEVDRNAGWGGLVSAYGPVLLLGLLPWWPLALFRRRPDPIGAGNGPAGVPRLLAVWIALPLAVFALAQSRLPLYLLPLAAPASIALALRLGPLEGSRRGLRVLAIGAAAALIALKGLAATHESDRDGRRLAKEILSVAAIRPAEVDFVGTRPRYALAFYLDCDVGSIRLAQDAPDERPAYRPLTAPLAAELLKPVHGRRLFLVMDGRREAFLDEVRALGFETHEHGRVRRMSLFDDPRRLDGEPAGADEVE